MTPEEQARITRIEVIDDHGRVYTKWRASIQLSIQDQGRTLKIFVTAPAEGVAPLEEKKLDEAFHYLMNYESTPEGEPDKPVAPARQQEKIGGTVGLDQDGTQRACNEPACSVIVPWHGDGWCDVHRPASLSLSPRQEEKEQE